LLGGDEDEFEFSNAGGQNKEDDEFDTIVGALQDIVIDEEFEMLQNDFLDKHCMVFEDEEENKLEYMPIFNNYQKTLEKYIEQVGSYNKEFICLETQRKVDRI
jgi:The ARF-like 2 binding protein BART.